MLAKLPRLAYGISGNGKCLFAGIWRGGVFRSTDNGGNWDEFNDGLAVSSINALHAFNAKLYAGTDGGGVFEAALDPKAGGLQKSFKPRNPGIRLSYGSGKLHLLAAGRSDERLKLEIFDLRGRMVLTLDAPKGRTAPFPFAEPPGIYVARIKAGNSHTVSLSLHPDNSGFLRKA